MARFIKRNNSFVSEVKFMLGMGSTCPDGWVAKIGFMTLLLIGLRSHDISKV